MLGSKCSPCCSCGNIAPITNLCAYSIRIFGYDTTAGQCTNGYLFPVGSTLPGNMITATATKATPNWPALGTFNYSNASRDPEKDPFPVAVDLLNYTGAEKACWIRQSDNQKFCPREQIDFRLEKSIRNGRPLLIVRIVLDAFGHLKPDADLVGGRIDFYVEIGPMFDFSDDADFCEPAPACGYPPASWNAYAIMTFVSNNVSGSFVSVNPIDEMPFYTANCTDSAVLDLDRDYCPQKKGNANCSFCETWHLPEEVPVSLSFDTGITINGVNIPLRLQSLTAGRALSDWNGPREITVTIVKNKKCCFTDCDPDTNHCCPFDSSECDCEADLTGRTVVFQEQTFTYGSGQTFNSDDGLIVWEESRTGTFRKIIYDNCDPSQRIKTFEETAEVFCTNIDGTDFWAVQLIVQCFERDACSPPFDRSRTITWNGILECDFNGYPFGSSETEFASNIPSNPAPTGSCISLPEIPSFSFT